MSKVPTKDKPQVLRTIKKVVNKKAKPTENLSLELLKDTEVGEYLRLFLGHVGGTANEMILHHPIGVTDLDKDEWVLSTPEDIAHLKARSEDPNKASIHAQRLKALKDGAILAGLVAEKDGALVYPMTGMARSSFISGLKLRHENKHQYQKDYKFILDLALGEEDPADLDAQSEIAYRKWLKQNQPVVEKKFPLTYRTLKGPLMDTPQAPIPWLKGMKIGETSSSLLKHGIVGPVTGIGNADPDDLTTNPSGEVGQWFFYQSLDASKKDKARDHAKEIRKILGGDVVVVIKHN